MSRRTEAKIVKEHFSFVKSRRFELKTTHV